MGSELYITAAKRTAIGSFMGSLANMPAHELGAIVAQNILSESGIDPNLIDEVIIGQALTAGTGQNPARQLLIKSGLPISTPAMTINKVCGSGLKSVILAANAIKANEANIILAGGQENMSLTLHGCYLRTANKFGNHNMLDLMLNDGLTDAFSSLAMGNTAENIAEKFNITRQMQDLFAYQSQNKARVALERGRFQQEIVRVKNEMIDFAQDENIRLDSNLEKLSKIRSFFKKDGTVTAGNSSSLNDGAAMLLIASESAVSTHKLMPLARIVSYASYGVDPQLMGTGPVPASKIALEKAGWKISDLDLIEANEAFAVQAVYVNQAMGWDESIVNVNGGAIALGHPIGASGARILVSLVHEMKKRNARKGLATLCIGGGMGVSMCIENF